MGQRLESLGVRRVGFEPGEGNGGQLHILKYIEIWNRGQAGKLGGSVPVRTLTAHSPGGRDGWAFGNPIGPASRPPECRDRRTGNRQAGGGPEDRKSTRLN